jgi:hypothetical protein
MMTRDEYVAWWGANTDDDGELAPWLSDVDAALAEHVMALQDRVDRLPDELRCCCAYDDPRDVCLTHAEAKPVVA